jgi:peptidoglycan biosynthesis protein MviN/MurJ (putative lipid II flippase)
VVTAVVWAIAAFAGLRIADWRALVVANTLQNCVHAVILAALLVRREPAILQERVLSSWGRSLAASMVAGAACFVALAMFTDEFGTGRLAQAASLLVVGSCGALLFALVLFVWRGDERRLVQRVFSRQAT